MIPTPEQVQSWAREASATGDGQELSGDALLRFAALACAWRGGDGCGDLRENKKLSRRASYGCA